MYFLPPHMVFLLNHCFPILFVSVFYAWIVGLFQQLCFPSFVPKFAYLWYRLRIVRRLCSFCFPGLYRLFVNCSCSFSSGFIMPILSLFRFFTISFNIFSLKTTSLILDNANLRCQALGTFYTNVIGNQVFLSLFIYH